VLLIQIEKPGLSKVATSSEVETSPNVTKLSAHNLTLTHVNRKLVCVNLVVIALVSARPLLLTFKNVIEMVFQFTGEEVDFVVLNVVLLVATHMVITLTNMFLKFVTHQI